MPDQMELSPEVDAKASAVATAAEQARARAEAMEVTNDAEAGEAAALLREVNRQRREGEKERKSLKEPILEAGRRLDARFREVMEPLDAVDEVLRGKLGTYQAEQDRIRREEEARLERERQEREAAERARREEAERVERERRQQAEREAQEAEAEKRKAKDAEDRAAAEALAEEKRQEAAAAAEREEAIAAEPEPAPLPRAEVAPAAPPSGVQMKKVWKATVVDAALVPRRYLVVDEKAINAAVRAGERHIDGVRIEQVDQMAVRG